ncbi:MAG: VacJ family lipoprotein [Massilia sp.]
MYRTNYRSRMHSIPAFGLSIAILGALGGCATGPDRIPGDPLEPLNRATFRFNDALDRNVARPLAERYTNVTPRPLRIAIGNFFSNISDFPIMVNNFAQGRGGDGLSDLMRIATNTFFGIGGLIDIATPAGIPKHDQDFGLTLGHWGVPPGPFLVLPLFGPSTFRDAAGFGVDQEFYPVNYADSALRNSLWGLNFVSTRARYLNATNLLEEAALDKYTFTRDAYLGRRRTMVSEGRGEESLPNYGEPAPGAKPSESKPGDAAPAGKPADDKGGQPATGQ